MANTKKYVSLDKLGLYDEKIKGVISAGDAATLASAKSYADGLASNYDAAGSASTVQGNLDTEIARAKAAEEANAAAAKQAQDEVDALELVVAGKAAQSDLEALEGYVGTIPTVEGEETPATIVAYVQKKTAGIATSDNLAELSGRVTTVEGEVATIKGDYLKSTDKTELEGKITTAQSAAEAADGRVAALEQTHATDKGTLEGAIALKADQTALDAVSAVANAAATQTALTEEANRAKGEEARIEGLVTAEAERAAGVEAGLDERLVEVEAFFKLAEGETLDTALDTLVEIQTYITGEGSAADQMVLDIAANKKAIEDHVATNHDFATADATLKSELEGKIDLKADKTTVEGIDGRLTTAEGKITTLEGKVSTLEGEMDAVEGAVATKVEQEAYNAKIEALEGKDTELAGKITALEGKFTGEGSVEDMIGDAKQEAIDAAATDATTKANTAESNAKGHADSLNTAMNTRVEALEAIDHDHSNKAELDLIVTGDKAKWDAAAAKAHEHSNLSVLEGITSAKVTAWDAAEGNAKTYADGLNTAMDTRVTAIETWHANFVEVSEEEINALFA